MRVFRVKMKSAGAYTQRKYHDTPKKDKERPDDWEKRTWRESMHVNGSGNMIIPPSQFQKCAQAGARYLSIQIPGKGKSTYTKHFASGVLVTEGIDTGIKKEEVQPMPLMVPSDGRPGGGKRVLRYFPTIPKWEGEVDFNILDDTITKDVFEEVFKEAGNLIGIGALRPQNGGWHGRFTVISVKELEK